MLQGKAPWSAGSNPTGTTEMMKNKTTVFTHDWTTVEESHRVFYIHSIRRGQVEQ